LKGENNRGFWLIPEMHRKGLMTEAVIAVNDYWFDVLGFPSSAPPTRLPTPPPAESPGKQACS